MYRFGPSLVPLVSLVLVFASACTPKAPPQTGPVSEPVMDTSDRSAADSARARAAREAAERQRIAEREDAARRERDRVDAIMLAPIHFEFDRSDLTLDARANLDTKLAVLRANPRMRLRIEGHADERGSSEYNLALGMRRAAAVRRYLLQRDIPGERLDTGSQGEERPTCETSSEDCWRNNRRAEFFVVSR